MKNFNFFEKLWEHGRTLRRVGLVLVMCLITITQMWAWTGIQLVSDFYGSYSKNAQDFTFGDEANKYWDVYHDGGTHYWRLYLCYFNHDAGPNTSNYVLNVGTTGYKVVNTSTNSFKTTGDAGIIRIQTSQNHDGASDERPNVWVTRPTVKFKYPWDGSKWELVNATDNHDGTYTYRGTYRGTNYFNAGPNDADKVAKTTTTVNGSPTSGQRCEFKWQPGSGSSGTNYKYTGGEEDNRGVFTITKLLTVTYDANGATKGAVPDPQEILYNTSSRLATNSGNLEKVGYKFKGWYTTSTGTGGTHYAAGGSITRTSNITLYAEWEAADVWCLKGQKTSGSGTDYLGGWSATQANLPTFSYTTENALVLELYLGASQTYSFGIYKGNNSGSELAFYKNGGSINGTLTAEKNPAADSEWEFTTGASNCTLTTGVAGTYVFTIDATSSNPRLRVYYPGDAPKVFLKKKSYIYLNDTTTSAIWQAGSFVARFWFKATTEDVHTDKIQCLFSNALGKDYMYYVQVPDRDYVDRVQINRMNPSDLSGNPWNYSQVKHGYTRTNAKQNCLVLPTSGNWGDGSANWANLSWGTYCPPMSSATLAHNDGEHTTTIYGGDGGEDTPYLVATSSSIYVSASSVSALDDDNMTPYYQFKKAGSNDGGESSTATHTYTASGSNNTKQAMTVVARNYYYTTAAFYGKASPASDAIYYEARTPYSVTPSLTNITVASGRTGSAAIVSGVDYVATLEAASGYNLPAAITVTRGGSDITANCTWDHVAGTLTIPAAQVTGNLTITAAGVSCPTGGSVYKFVPMTTSGNVSLVGTPVDITNNTSVISSISGGTLEAYSANSGDVKKNGSDGLYLNADGGYLILKFNCPLEEGDVVKWTTTNTTLYLCTTTTYNSSTDLACAKGTGKVEITSDMAGLKTLYIKRSGSALKIQSFEITRPHTITLSIPDGATCSASSLLGIEGAEVVLPHAFKSGERFLGWYNDPSSGTKQDDHYTVSGTTTLYARFGDCLENGTIFSMALDADRKPASRVYPPKAGTMDLLPYADVEGGAAYAGNLHSSIDYGGVSSNPYIVMENNAYVKVQLDCSLVSGDVITLGGFTNSSKVWVSNSDTRPGSEPSTVANSSSPSITCDGSNIIGTVFYVYYGASTNFTSITVTRPCIPPTIGSQPSSTSICSGSTATLSVGSISSGSGSGTYTYQWYDASNDSEMSTGSGYNTASFTTPTLNAAASYYCIVSETGGCDVKSSTASVSMKTATSVSFSDYTLDASVDESFEITGITAAGSGTLTYKWYSYTSSGGAGESEIDKATSSTYIFTPASAGDYYFKCQVTGDCGSVKSSMITVTAAVGCDDPSASLDDGEYTVGGSALDLRTLWNSDNTTDDVTFTVTNANGTGATIGVDGYSLTATTAGTATISASQTSTGDYCDAAETASITVTVPTYAITYNKGSYGSGGAIAAGEKTYGVNFTLSSSTYTRDGYIQMGWSTSDGGAKAYDLGGTYTSNAALSLYPYWARKSTYTFDYANQKSISTLEGEGWTFNSKTFDGSPADNEAYVNLVSAMNTAGLTAPKSNSMDDYSIAFAKNSSAYALYDIGYATAVSAVTGTFYVGSKDDGITFDIVYLGSDGSTVKKTVTTTHNKTNWGSNSVSETTLVRDVRYIKIKASTKWLVMSQLNITYANLATNHTITSAVNTAGYGSVSPSSITVADASTISISSNVLTCDGNTLTATPTTSTAQYTYAFSNWTGVTNGAYVTTDLTATANFTRTLNSYTITWKNGDTTLETDEDVDYGETPSYDGSTPTKASTAEYDYSFNTWDPAVSTVTGDATYSATFTQTARSYTLTWDANGGDAGSCTGSCTSGTVAYGTTLVAPGDPTRDGYDFAGWSPTPAATMPAENTTYTAQWATKYTVTYEPMEGTCATKNATGSSVNPVTLPTPTHASYSFLGWYNTAGTRVGGAGDEYTPSGNITLYAKWSGSCAGDDPILSIGATEVTTSSFLGTYSTEGITLSSTGTWTKDKVNDGDIPIESAAGYDANYFEVLASGADIEKVSFLLTGNGSDKSLQPVVFGWASAASTTADTYRILEAKTVSNKGYSNAEWFTYDFSESSVKRLRLYKGVKNLSSINPAYTGTSDAIGNSVTIWIYGVKVWLKGSGAGTCYTVTYDGNGATSGYVNDPRRYTSGDNSAYVLSSNFHREDCYEVSCWNTAADGSGTDYQAGDYITVNDDITLYAQWRIIIDENTTDLTAYEDVKHKDVRVTNGATLTLTQDTTVRNMLVETGSTLKIATTAGDAGVKLTVKNLALAGGYGTVNNAIKYDMPRVFINSKSTLKKANSTVNFDISVTNQFSPIAVPFKVKVSDVKYAKKSLQDMATYLTHYAIKTYNGKTRAEGGSSNWNPVNQLVEVNKENVDNYLEPGRGYILAAMREAGYPFAVIRFPMEVDDAWTAGGEKGVATISAVETTKNAVSVTAWTKAVGETLPKNKGWNILGVPYMSCFASSGAGHDQANPYVMGKLNFSDGTYSDETYAYVSVPTHDFSEYIQEKVSDAVLLPGWCFFIQFDKTGTLTFDVDGQRQTSSLPIYAPKYEQENMPIVETGIVLSGNDASDKTTIIVSDRYTAAEYEINADLEKLFGDNGYSLATYSLSGTTRLAYNAMSNADAANIIPIGYRAPADGEYTFSINPRYAENGAFEQVNLIDYETGITTNLLLNSYSFSTERTQLDTRFALNVVPRKETPTDIETVGGEGINDANGPRKVLINDKMYIILDGKMYDATGKMLK